VIQWFLVKEIGWEMNMLKLRHHKMEVYTITLPVLLLAGGIN